MFSRYPGEYLCELQNDTKLEKYVLLVHMYIFLVWCRERSSRTDMLFTTNTGPLVADQSNGGTGRSVHNSCRRIFDPGLLLWWHGWHKFPHSLIVHQIIPAFILGGRDDSMSSESPGFLVWDSAKSHPPRTADKFWALSFCSQMFFYIPFCVTYFRGVKWRVHHKSQSLARVDYSSYRHVQPSIVAYLIARCSCPFQKFDVGNRSEVSTKALSTLNMYI